MIAIDTDVLAICHIFKKDPRFEITNRFIEKIVGSEKTVTAFNTLEFYGVLITTTGEENASEIFHRFISSIDIKPKLRDSFSENLINQSILRKCNHPTSVIPACRESFFEAKKDSEQVGMTERRIAQLGS